MCALTGSSSTTSTRRGEVGASSVQLIMRLLARGDGDLIDQPGKMLDEIVPAPATSRLLAQDLDRVGARSHRLIGPRCRDRLERVDQSDDLRRERDRIAFDPVGISRTVQPLMVVADDHPDLSK